MGGVSVIRTRSPTPHSFFSSWTLNRVRCCTVLRYSRCALDEPTWTIAVLSILSAITVPRRTLRRPRAGAVGVTVAVSLTRPPPSCAHARALAWVPLRQRPRLRNQRLGEQPLRSQRRPPPHSVGRTALPWWLGRSRSRARGAPS